MKSCLIFAQCLDTDGLFVSCSPSRSLNQVRNHFCQSQKNQHNDKLRFLFSRNKKKWPTTGTGKQKGGDFQKHSSRERGQEFSTGEKQKKKTKTGKTKKKNNKNIKTLHANFSRETEEKTCKLTFFFLENVKLRKSE